MVRSESNQKNKESPSEYPFVLDSNSRVSLTSPFIDVILLALVQGQLRIPRNSRCACTRARWLRGDVHMHVHVRRVAR